MNLRDRKTHQVWRGEGGDKAEKPLNLTWAWQGLGDEKRQEPRHSGVKILACMSGSSLLLQFLPHRLVHTMSALRRKMPSLLCSPYPLPLPFSTWHSQRKPPIQGAAQPHPITKREQSIGLWLHLLVVLGTEADKTRRELGTFFEKSDPYMTEKITTGRLNI